MDRQVLISDYETIEGEFLDCTINKFARPIDQYIKLPDQKQGMLGNHKMSSVINALKNVGKTSY